VTTAADGDTIWVDNNGDREKARLIGMGTPESPKASVVVSYQHSPACWVPQLAQTGFSGEVRGTLFTNDQTGTEVDEAVVAFDTAAHARDFVASTAGTWLRCSDEVLTITSAGRPPRTFTIDVPHAVGADEVTDCQSQSYKGWGTVHAMRADGDIVIDVRVTGEGLGDQAVRVVNAIVDHGRI
jgi:hypothetical protein